MVKKLFIFCAVSLVIPFVFHGRSWAEATNTSKIIPIFYLLLTDNSNKTVLDYPVILNDTGITWGGNDYLSGNNVTCTSDIDAPQDCHQGRDVTHNDDSDGHAGFSYTKLDMNGNNLPASATQWSCVRDNVTGLVWEVKTDDGGIHDKDNTYRWGGKTALGSDFGTYYSDWDSLVDGSNSEQLCGFSDWRVPTRQELQGLVNYGRINPSIDTAYFPDIPYLPDAETSQFCFWSASPDVRGSVANVAWNVNFYSGEANGPIYRSVGYRVRLVRSGQRDGGGP